LLYPYFPLLFLGFPASNQEGAFVLALLTYFCQPLRPKAVAGHSNLGIHTTGLAQAGIATCRAPRPAHTEKMGKGGNGNEIRPKEKGKGRQN